MKKKGAKKYKEFNTKSGKLNDIAEEKFKIRLIDHYYRLLQKVIKKSLCKFNQI